MYLEYEGDVVVVDVMVVVVVVFAVLMPVFVSFSLLLVFEL